MTINLTVHQFGPDKDIWTIIGWYCSVLYICIHGTQKMTIDLIDIMTLSVALQTGKINHLFIDISLHLPDGLAQNFIEIFTVPIRWILRILMPFLIKLNCRPTLCFRVYLWANELILTRWIVNIIPAKYQHVSFVIVSILARWCWLSALSSTATKYSFTELTWL